MTNEDLKGLKKSYGFFFAFHNMDDDDIRQLIDNYAQVLDGDMSIAEFEAANNIKLSELPFQMRNR